MTVEPDSAAATDRQRQPVTIPRPAPIGRRLAVGALVVGSALNLAEAIVNRVVGEGASVASSLDAWAAHPTLGAIGLAIGTLAVPFLILALIAMAQLIRPRMPRLGATAMGFGFVGGLGFLGIHAVSVIDHAAADQPDRGAMVALLESAQNSSLGLLIVVPFMLGMAGSVLLTSIGYLRTRVVPLWIPAVFLLFLVLDFGGFPTGPVDPHWLFVAASLGVAVAVFRRTDRQWWLGGTPEEGTS
jgi:hypothetical protein